MRTHNDAALLSGVAGYAHKQAAICLRMGNQCARYWLPQMKRQGITPSWAIQYAEPPHAVVPQVGSEGETPGIGDEVDLDSDDDEDEDEDDEIFEIESGDDN